MEGRRLFQESRERGGASKAAGRAAVKREPPAALLPSRELPNSTCNSLPPGSFGDLVASGLLTSQKQRNRLHRDFLPTLTAVHTFTTALQCGVPKLCSSGEQRETDRRL
jgi:hypothetical protein